jgi:hypothetical protein
VFYVWKIWRIFDISSLLIFVVMLAGLGDSVEFEFRFRVCGSQCKAVVQFSDLQGGIYVVGHFGVITMILFLLRHLCPLPIGEVLLLESYKWLP